MYVLILTLSKMKNGNDDDEEISPSQEILINLSEDPIENAAMKFFKFHTCTIEIFFQNKLHRVIFPIQPCCRNLSKTTKVKLMENVNRESSSTKINV